MSGSIDYVQTIQQGVTIVLGIAIGYVTCKWNLLPKSANGSINRFVLRTCFLPLIARSIWTRDVYHMSFYPFAIGVVTSITFAVILSIVTFALKRCLSCDWMWLDLSIFLPVCYLNYLVIGLPIFNSLWGEDENIALVVMNLHCSLCTIPIYVLLVNIYKIRIANAKHKEDGDGKVERLSPRLFLSIGLPIITNPFVIGAFLSFAWALTRWPPCPFLANIMKYLGDSVLAFCLFTVGGFLSQHSLLACGVLHFIVTMLLRVIAFPMVAGLYGYAFQVGPRLAKQCMIAACIPTATSGFIISNENDTGPGVTSTMILWSTVLTVPVILAWLYILEALHIFVE